MPITLERATELGGGIHCTQIILAFHYIALKVNYLSQTSHGIGLQPFDHGGRPGKLWKILQPLLLNPSSSKE